MKKHIFCLFIFLLVGCNTRKEEIPPESRSVPVTVVHPSVQEVSFHIETIGSLQPKANAEIFPLTDGYITEIHVKEGQHVKKGQSLFSLDQAIHKIHVQEAQAQLDIEQATFQGLQKKMDRYRSLAQKDLISKTEWDELETQVEKARCSIELHTATLQKAKIELDQCTIKSPLDGRVGKIPPSVGVFVKNMTTTLTNITQIDSLIVECSLTEKEFYEMPKDVQHILVTPLSSSGTTRTGIITFFDTSFETSWGVLLVKGLIENTEGDTRLLPGQIVLVRIPTRTDPSVVLIPQKAIRYNQQGPYVYTVTPELTAAICQIVLGEERGTDRIVQKGLSPEDTIIIDGHLRLSAGCKVSV